MDNLALEQERALAHIVPDFIFPVFLITISLSVSPAVRLADYCFQAGFPPWLKASCRASSLHFPSVTTAKSASYAAPEQWNLSLAHSFSSAGFTK